MISAILKKLGAKAQAWNMEFRSDKWDRPTVGDAVYPVLAKYPGSVLDMGCGSGVMTTEITIDRYTGVDISKQAIRKARTLNPQHTFYVSSIEEFVPDYRYDVILFRESLYYVKEQKALLEKLKKYLSPQGVFIVRIHDKVKHAHTVNVISAFTLMAMSFPDQGIILVFK